MNLPHFKFHHRDLTIHDAGSLTEDELRTLSTAIFDAWTGATPKGTDPSDSTQLQAHMRKRTEGLGDAEVWELRFVRTDHETSVARFILRAHRGEASTASASREREIVSLLHSTASECFSTEIIDALPNAPDVVVYRHAADQVDGEAITLSSAIEAAFADSDTTLIRDIASRLRELGRGAIQAFDRLSVDGSVRSGAQYFQGNRNRLLPDIILDARQRLVTADPSGTIDIATIDASSPPVSSVRVSAYDGPSFSRRLESGTFDGGWVQLNDAWFLGRSRRNSDCSVFRSGTARIWLRTDSAAKLPLTDRAYAIRVHSKDHVAITPREALRQTGFSEDSYVSDAEVEEVHKRISQLTLVPIHTDLHTQNIVYSPGRLKIVDVGSVDRDLAVTAGARLETSVWYDIVDKLALEKDEISELLLALDTPAVAAALDVGPIASSAYELLSASRAAFQGSPAPTNEIEALAYVTQIMLHQRYFLETHSGSAIGLPFRMFAEHWVLKLRRALDPAAGISVLGVPAESELARLARSGERSLGDLWELAFRSPRTDIVDARARRILAAFATTDPQLFGAALTELQASVFDLWETERCFQSDRHVIIAGPTSCGKSKLAEMFLAGPAVWNTRRTCTLYIAPTRALAQAKYRELRELFASVPEFHESIVVSTGENTDDDWRITHGRFTIASLVYEKANILFSQNAKLLDRVACVVIDEMHMLMDLERGPTLEIAALKLLLERRRLDFQQSRDPARELLRLVAISTEDRPDTALVSLLSSYDSEQPNRKVEPIVYHGQTRPVSVEHALVLAGQGETAFTLIPVVEFTSARERQLSRERLQELDTTLDATWNAPEMRELRDSRKDPRRELRTRLIELLVDELTRHPLGYRALIFVPGRAEVENLAQRLRNQLRDRHIFGTGDDDTTHQDLYNRIKIVADAVEDQRTAEIVRKCAAYGIMVHHADIDRKVRTAIETVCATQPNTAPSQVLFATETLSYGVNLAVTDVVLLGTTFYAQNRLRELRSEPLSICAFHNMAGRAGRLGRRGQFKTHVYILVPFDEPPMGVLQRYYTKVLPVTSQLYVEDDKQGQFRIEDNWFTRSLVADTDPCVKYRGLGAMDFSYPYVRTVLDALRHLNISSGNRAVDAKVPAKFDELLEIFGSSLYAAQRLSRPAGGEEAILFKCAVRRVLDDCASAHLDLVKIDSGSTLLYTITARGEAIIDTGTELHTVEPMLRFVAWLHKTWLKHAGKQQFPTDLYVLAIVTQSEISRQFVRYTPECRSDDPDRGWNVQLAEANRDAVLGAFTSSLRVIGVHEPERLATDIRSYLDDFDSIRGKIRAAYPCGGTDGVLRLFNGLIAWIHGDERSVVEDKIEVVEAADALRTKMQGFRQFTDQVSWKTLFLAKMLASATPGPLFGPDDERMLHMLVSRLRLGCTPEAVPLFWPHSSDFRRAQAVALLQAGMTPNRLVCMPEPHAVVSKSVGISPDKLDKLCRDLEKLAVKEFAELTEEMTAVEPADDRREGVHRLWRGLSAALPGTVVQFRRQNATAPDIDGIVRDSLRVATGAESGPRTLGPRGRTLDRQFRVRVEIPDEANGVFLIAEQALDESHQGARETFSTHFATKAIGIHLSKNWQCRSGNSPWMGFADFLEREASTPNLLIVPFPWLPAFDVMPPSVRKAFQVRRAMPRSHTLFVSGAAFATIVTCIARDFFTGESLMRSIAVSDSTPTFLGIKAIQPLLDGAPNPLPPAIREKIIRHFEVEPFGLTEAFRLD